jgi:hypothetical protein
VQLTAKDSMSGLVSVIQKVGIDTNLTCAVW